MARLSTQIHKLQETNKKLQKTNIEQQKENEKLKAQLEKDEKSWSAQEGSLRYSDTCKPLHNIERLDRIIYNQKNLQSLTGCTCEKFQYLLDEITQRWKVDPNAPLCTEDGADTHGNRCKLPQRHIVLLTLEPAQSGHQTAIPCITL